MELKRPLKIPVFFHGDESTTMEDMEVEYTMDHCEEGMMTFYRVDAVSSFKDKSGTYGVVHVSGTEYITKIQKRELEKMVEVLCKDLTS